MCFERIATALDVTKKLCRRRYGRQIVPCNARPLVVNHGVIVCKGCTSRSRTLGWLTKIWEIHTSRDWTKVLALHLKNPFREAATRNDNHP